MLKIIQQNKEYEFNFDGVKIFNAPNPTLLYKQIFTDSTIFIDGKIINKEDIIYIDELSKTDQFINLTKKSELLKQVIDLIATYPLINNENLQQIITKINEELQLEVLEFNEGDITKIITTFLDVVDLNYLDQTKFDIILEKYLNSKKLFILNNLSWINIQKLYSYINEHNFIIITNDFRRYINHKNELETLVIFKDNYVYTEILDYEKTLAYLEMKTNTFIDDKVFHNFLLGTEVYLNYQIMLYLEKIN